MCTAACSASTPLSGMAACAILPWTVTSSCRQPLCAVTTSIAEARRDQQVGLGQFVAEQPARPEFAAELLVISEVQFDTALERRLERLQRAHRESEAGEVALAHGGGPAIDLAVHDLAAVGIVGPALARRHHVTASGISSAGSPTSASAPAKPRPCSRPKPPAIEPRPAAHRRRADPDRAARAPPRAAGSSRRSAPRSRPTGSARSRARPARA